MSIDVTGLAAMIDKPVFRLVGEAADELSRECYVVGGYVRDLMLGRHSKDIDFVTVGSGIEVAKRVARKMKGSHLSAPPRSKVANASWNLLVPAGNPTGATAASLSLRTEPWPMTYLGAISP